MRQQHKEYTINMRGGALVFKTFSYKTEEGSALHSGIYNRELTSALAAGAVLVALAVAAVYMKLELSLIQCFAAIPLFGLLFVLFRWYVFFEEYLEVVFDKAAGRITVFVKGMPSMRTTRLISDMAGVKKGLVLFAPENPDGIEVVRKIALQHNMVLPGFGEAKSYHTVNLDFKDLSTSLIYVSEEQREAEAVIDLLNNFMGGSIAQAH